MEVKWITVYEISFGGKNLELQDIGAVGSLTIEHPRSKAPQEAAPQAYKLRLRNVLFRDELHIHGWLSEREKNETACAKTYATEDGAKRAKNVAHGVRSVDIAVKLTQASW